MGKWGVGKGCQGEPSIYCSNFNLANIVGRHVKINHALIKVPWALRLQNHHTKWTESSSQSEALESAFEHLFLTPPSESYIH